MTYLPKLLIIGHARHGKDSVAELLKDLGGYKFKSSSVFCGEETIWDNWGCAVYDTFDDMFEDRVNNRTLWAQMISAYNIPDKTKTASTMLKRGYDMYVGMRMRNELEACLRENVFDLVVWVDRCQHLPEEPYESMELNEYDADVVIDNNGSIEELEENVKNFLKEYVND